MTNATVSGTYLAPDGQPESGSVTFELIPPALDNLNQQRTPGVVTVDLDVTGSFSVDLIPDDDLLNLDGDALYWVTENVGMLRRGWYLTISDDTPINLPERYPGTTYTQPAAILPLQGPQGEQGIQGEQGPQGEPGEVTQAGMESYAVAKAGDTMTGPLVVGPGTDYNNGLTLAGRSVAGSQLAISQGTTDPRYYFRMKDSAGGTWRTTAQIEGDEGWIFKDSIEVLAPTAATHPVRLARTPNAATGDLGLPGWAGSDTGWRDVTADLINGWTATEVRLRRAGATVFVILHNINGEAATAANILTLDYGFRLGFSRNGLGAVYNGATGATATLRSSLSISGSQGEYVRAITGILDSTGQAQFLSDNNWPTTLPGTEITPPVTHS